MLSVFIVVWLLVLVMLGLAQFGEMYFSPVKIDWQEVFPPPVWEIPRFELPEEVEEPPVKRTILPPERLSPWERLMSLTDDLPDDMLPMPLARDHRPWPLAEVTMVSYL